MDEKTQGELISYSDYKNDVEKFIKNTKDEKNVIFEEITGHLSETSEKRKRKKLKELKDEEEHMRYMLQIRHSKLSNTCFELANFMMNTRDPMISNLKTLNKDDRNPYASKSKWTLKKLLTFFMRSKT